MDDRVWPPSRELRRWEFFAIYAPPMVIAAVVAVAATVLIVGLTGLAAWLAGTMVGGLLAVYGLAVWQWLVKKILGIAKAAAAWLARLALNATRGFTAWLARHRFLKRALVGIALATALALGGWGFFQLPREGQLAVVVALVLTLIGLALQVRWYRKRQSLWRCINKVDSKATTPT